MKEKLLNTWKSRAIFAGGALILFLAIFLITRIGGLSENYLVKWTTENSLLWVALVAVIFGALNLPYVTIGVSVGHVFGLVLSLVMSDPSQSSTAHLQYLQTLIIFAVLAAITQFMQYRRMKKIEKINRETRNIK